MIGVAPLRSLPSAGDWKVSGQGTMAKEDLLSCLAKRDLLNQTVVSVETLLHWGKVHEDEGLVHDAVNFYEKANAREDLARLLGRAQEDGDVFLYSRLCRLLDHKAEKEDWIALARRAEEAGKHSFAAEAYRRAGLETSAEQGDPTEPAL